MRHVLLLAMLALWCARAGADVLYQQPPGSGGVSYVSSWWEPDGSNYDRYVWDAFSVGADADVGSIAWRGTYGASGPASNFTVAIYASIAAGTQPDFSRPPLLEVDTGGNAGETYAGDFGGVAMYDYAFTLPAAFHAQAGVKYWLEIAGWQSGFPDWSLAAGLGGDGSHFLCEHNNLFTGDGVPTGCWFTSRTGDVAFTLLSSGPTGVDPPSRPDGLALARIAPNPSSGDRLDVSFSLPDAAPARLALLDVSGRCVTAVELVARGAGWHVVDLAGSSRIAPGIYFIRLTHGGRDATTRVAVIH